jgi:hypothetical protein
MKTRESLNTMVVKTNILFFLGQRWDKSRNIINKW